jgi:hypothetical protein
MQRNASQLSCARLFHSGVNLVRLIFEAAPLVDGSGRHAKLAAQPGRGRAWAKPLPEPLPAQTSPYRRGR